MKSMGEIDGQIEALIARGAYVEAAQLAASDGQTARAVTLYERVWRFADAVPLALAIGNRALAVRLCLDAGDPQRAAEIAAAIPGEDVADLAAAAEAFASRSRPHEGAQAAERAGQIGRAASLYRRAGAIFDAARVLEAQGNLHEAGSLYERVIQAGASAGNADDTARARLALGRLLARLGRPLDAARALQAAARAAGIGLAARRALCSTLLALGLREAAGEVARRLRRDAPDLPASPEEIAALERDGSPTGGPPSSPSSPGASRSSLFGQRFRVQRLLGSGATGRVYLADDTLLGRPVAVKLLSVGAGAAGPERQAYLRFAREAEAAGRLRHPNIVALCDFDESAGLLVLEHMSGGTLRDALSRGGPLAPAAARRLALEALAGLAAAHERHIVHRDVKPANLFFDAAGNTKVGDFGAAHLQDFGQTQTGGFMGTIAYMSPEQITGAAIGPPADLYALSVTLFEALTGRRPFPGPDIVGQHLGEEPPRPTAVRRDLAPAHDEVILRGLRKAPGDRYESAAEMAAAVRAWPVDASDDGRSARGEETADAAAAAAGAAAASDPKPTTESGGTEIGKTPSGTLFLREDPRVGRPVLVETRSEPLDDAQRSALRKLAGLGGPLVQRILQISEDGREITYEALAGPPITADGLPAEEATAVIEALSNLARAGVPLPSPCPLVVRTSGGPVILVIAPAR